MSFDNLFKKRMQASGGSVGGNIEQDKIDYINDSISDSPFYQEVLLDGVEVGARINRGDGKNTRQVAFVPDADVQLGSMVEFDDDKWMVVDGDFNNKSHLSVRVYLCNEDLRWYDRDGNYHELPAVLSFKTSIYSFKFDTRADELYLPEGQIRLYTQYNEESKKIELENRFIFGDRTVFKVDGLDDFSESFGEHGIMNMVARIDTKNDKDDFENRIADNSHLRSEPPEDDEDNGGGLW